MLFIFDLDGTIIDSSHRQLAKPDGSINLKHWRENNTPEKIAGDALLPLAYDWQGINRAYHTIVVMTARVMGNDDLKFLERNNLKYDWLYSRMEGDTTTDDILKRRMIFDLAWDLGKSIAWVKANAYFFDDNKKVRDIMAENGIRAFDPTAYNFKNSRG